MLKPRIIPVLLLHNGGLIKTIRFHDAKYVGDPLNAVRIFNEKEVDELIVIDISATTLKKDPEYKLIAQLAEECRMPLCYGGGVKNVEQLERIVSLGVEKVATSSAIIETPSLIEEAAKRVGSQSVVVVMDVKKTGMIQKRYEIFTHNGKRPTGLSPTDLAVKAESAGAGELLINSIDQDGTMAGYDMALIDQVHSRINMPLTVLGGAGSLADLQQLLRKYSLIGAAAGSLFVFKGKYRAVLIQYLNSEEKQMLTPD